MKLLSAEQAARVEPRPASTTLVVRDGEPGLEVLMVRRSLNASFMPGAHVFPGGAVDDADAACLCDETPQALVVRVGDVTGVGERAAAHAVAALRECFEECGLWLGNDVEDGRRAALRARLDGGEEMATLARDAGLEIATSALQPWSRWLTPFGRPKRFDTLFFLVRAPEGQTPEADEGESIALEWVHPPTALTAHRDGVFPMEFATLRTIESLLPFAASREALFAYAATLRTVPHMRPRLQLDTRGAVCAVLLPGEPGYEQAYGAGIE